MKVIYYGISVDMNVKTFFFLSDFEVIHFTKKKDK